MASLVDTLLLSFEKVISEPWTQSLSVSERMMFLVFDPAELRKVELRMGDFETTTKRAGKKWLLVSLKECFATWMASHEYHEEYFADPKALIDQLDDEFKQYAIDFLNEQIDKVPTDDQTLVALHDVTALFGFARLSEVLNGVRPSFKGRVLVFFPGEYEHNHFRLLDARDGWSYLARPITA